ncbi:hypothetical protein BDBG_04509 [Blastomyces gilchristii SLH14081]|uniref:FAR-17a/AIG1-like protein n=1 Tax=Blastomyces gilchristii (strain SLH14081) TaxID=559298 RepID=A0A179ULS0_BLAGS|nr:uncharacterized protein BDBG_04509 [Blastomyces gilchristii SLH14081]OAT08914.1 hypothetical protein BDBG_04509 [Blastomyces gilchristii SLH14081]
MPSMNVLMGADPANDPLHHFETSWLFYPLVFGILRLTIFFYCILTAVISFAVEGASGHAIDDARSFSYFTSLSFLGVLVYFLVAGIHTVLYARQGRSVLFDKWPRWLRALHSLLYTTIVCYPFVVVAIYWSLLYKAGSVQSQLWVWGNISKHVLPAIFAVFEIVFSTAPPPPLLHLPFLILLLLLYLGVAYITHAAEGFWVYPFLNPGPNGSRIANVVKYLCIVVAALLITFAVVWGASWVRRRLVGLKTKWAKGDVGGGGQDGRDAEMGENAEEVYVERK